MAPRRSRGESDLGRLSELRAALERRLDQVAEADQPVEIVGLVGETFTAFDAASEKLAEIRLRAVAQLRAEGWTYDQISTEAKVSKERVAQLSREARRLGY